MAASTALHYYTMEGEYVRQNDTNVSMQCQHICDIINKKFESQVNLQFWSIVFALNVFGLLRSPGYKECICIMKLGEMF